MTFALVGSINEKNVAVENQTNDYFIAVNLSVENCLLNAPSMDSVYFDYGLLTQFMHSGIDFDPLNLRYPMK